MLPPWNRGLVRDVEGGRERLGRPRPQMTTSLRLPISALILTRDEEPNLAFCLSSISPWSGEIHVLDSGSIDRTVEIAKDYGCLVHQHRYANHASQLMWALENISFNFPWLLLLDADNIVSARLRDDLAVELPKASPDVVGFYTGYEQYFRDRRVRGFKSRNLTVVKLGHVRVDPSELVDYRLVPDGKTGNVRGAMMHRNRKEDDINFWVDKHQRFAARQAAEEVLRSSGRTTWSFRPRLVGSPDERIAWFKQRWYRMPLFARPVLYFGYRYLVRLGILDGWNGLVFHVLQALWYRLLIDVNIMEIRTRIAAGSITLDDLAGSAGG